MPKFMHLLSQKLGYAADGRTLGLGLSVALAKQREQIRITVDEGAERHLRRWAEEERLQTHR
ncbi:hypothetical protein Misp01_01950 [Microtetraspora sp. NBRC 13810]|uniref:hypothetical protein n=1 Tax=Microtetraspora sp. NBRC 13810 TaxID=3030990 RepID=UPI0024A0C81E|nr:hypothetical protein [Microtetraspora sp. NBRC 13810]GLW05065.1 hypothetical protein Misp01_01950 [Microtetraspora sp. NBRC 13810]